MRIVIDATYLFNFSSEEYKIFAVEILRQTIQIHPETEFYILINEQNNQFISLHNVKTIIINSSWQKTFFFKWKHCFQTTKILKKIKPDVCLYLTPTLCSKTRIPSVLLLNHFKHINPQSVGNKEFDNKWHEKSIAFTDVIASIPAFSLTDIPMGKNTYNIGIMGREIFKPLHYNAKQAVKEQYTEGKEYFAYKVTDELVTTINMLKAFSLFKKRQHSNMFLIMIVSSHSAFLQLQEKLATFKYKNDVILLKDLTLNELWKIIASAYAFIHLENNALGLFAIEAMQCETPVIAAIDSFEKNMTLHAPLDNAEEISEQMQLLFKDESLRSQLIQNAKAVVEQMNWENVLNQLWMCIEKAINKY